MNKGLALRLVSVVLFGGVAIAACSGKSSTGSSADAGHGGGNRDAQTGPSGDATILEGAAGDDAEAGAGDDGSGQDAGAPCAPGTTQCAATGNGVQTCTSSGRWADPVDCGMMACVGGGCTGVCAPGTTQCSGTGVQTCNANGAWGNATPCTNQT